MAYTTIDDPSAYFQSILWTGNDTDGRALTNDGNSDLQPDLVWLKNRDAGYNHIWTDSTRGVTKQLYSNLTNAEGTDSNKVESFDTNGFTVGYDGSQVPNKSPRTFVAWQWKANGGTTSSNTDGSLTSTVQANTDAGFSIVTYTNPATGNKTVGHGLGVKPDMIIFKNLDTTVDWHVAHKDLANYTTYGLTLNTTGSQGIYTNAMNATEPTSSVFSIGGVARTGSNGNEVVAYCFASKQGFSKFGKYEGNANANGPFIYTGFKPALLIIKNASVVTHWAIVDNKRAGYNDDNYRLYTNLSNAENTSDTNLDILSNGFQIRTSDSDFNNGANIIYAAFAENPFVTSTGIPTTAR